jgi:hypothetical protein
MVEPSLDAPLLTSIDVHASWAGGEKNMIDRDKRKIEINNRRFIGSLLIYDVLSFDFMDES